jgi:hypothetical protein
LRVTSRGLGDVYKRQTEFGYRPVDGPFFNMGVGWSFYRE